MVTNLGSGLSVLPTQPRKRVFFFIFFEISRPGLRPTQLPIPRVKWLGRESDQLLPSSAKVKNEWGGTSTPL